MVNGSQPTYKVTAYDCLFDMQKSQDNVYYASGKKTETILKDIMKNWGVSVSSYKGPNVKHSKVVYKNKSLADIVLGILDEAKKKGGGTGYVRSVNGKVEFVMAGSNKDIFCLDNSNSVTSSYKISTVDMVTRVKIVTSSGKSDKVKVDATENGKTEYGIRQKIITRSKSEKLADAKKEAKEILAEDGKPKQTRKIQAPDVPCIRKGDLVKVSASANSGDYIVKSIQHNADKQIMTLQIETKPADPSSGTGSGSGGSGSSKEVKYKVTPRIGLNMRTGPNAKIITAIPYGTVVTSDGTSKSGWIHVKYAGKWGYSYGQYLKKV